MTGGIPSFGNAARMNNWYWVVMSMVFTCIRLAGATSPDALTSRLDNTVGVWSTILDITTPLVLATAGDGMSVCCFLIIIIFLSNIELTGSSSSEVSVDWDGFGPAVWFSMEFVLSLCGLASCVEDELMPVKTIEWIIQMGYERFYLTI